MNRERRLVQNYSNYSKKLCVRSASSNKARIKGSYEFALRFRFRCLLPLWWQYRKRGVISVPVLERSVNASHPRPLHPNPAPRPGGCGGLLISPFQSLSAFSLQRTCTTYHLPSRVLDDLREIFRSTFRIKKKSRCNEWGPEASAPESEDPLKLSLAFHYRPQNRYLAYVFFLHFQHLLKIYFYLSSHAFFSII